MSDTKYYSAVPWYSAEEWKYVFKLIFGPNSDEKCKKEALKILLIWKSRCSDLPSGIESTLGLLEVDLQTPVTESNSKFSDRLLRLMYSSVIMRFINHTLDEVSKSKGLTLLQAGPVVNIPQWIVNLRHETAHAHELSSLSLLKKAASFAMNWLFTHYWLPQNEIMSNVFISGHIQNDKFEYDLAQLISNHNLITVFSYHKFKIKKIHNIPDKEIKNDFLKFMNSDLPSNSKKKIDINMNIKDVIDIIIKKINAFLFMSKRDDKTECFSKLMLDSESLFMTPDIGCVEESDMKEPLPSDYYLIWEPILTYLHTRNMIGDLMTNLLRLVQSETETPERRAHAANWLKQIAIGLYKSKLFNAIPFVTHCESQDIIQESIQRLVHHHPNQKSGLTLNLLHSIPEELQTRDFILQMFSNVNPYIKIYIKYILAFIDTKLSQESIKQLIELVDIFSGIKLGDTVNENVHTVSDITMKNTSIIKNLNSLESIKMNVDIPSSLNSANLDKWERASVDYDWRKYPIGILPWQTTPTPINPTLSFESH